MKNSLALGILQTEELNSNSTYGAYNKNFLYDM